MIYKFPTWAQCANDDWTLSLSTLLRKNSCCLPATTLLPYNYGSRILVSSITMSETFKRKAPPGGDSRDRQLKKSKVCGCSKSLASTGANSAFDEFVLNPP